jgi:hypothetical protein
MGVGSLVDDFLAGMELIDLINQVWAETIALLDNQTQPKEAGHLNI